MLGNFRIIDRIAHPSWFDRNGIYRESRARKQEKLIAKHSSNDKYNERNKKTSSSCMTKINANYDEKYEELEF